MPVLQKFAKAKRMMASKGAAATLRHTGKWIDARVRYAVLGAPRPRYWRKFHLIHELAHMHGYRSVLEISTSMTGLTYDQLDRSRFTCRRLSYLTPDDWTDGAPVDYRSGDRDISGCMRQIHAQGLRFDVVFLDPWHEYDTTIRDMQDALSVVSDDGVIVMHDCLPGGEEYCTPAMGDLDGWNGVTYKAYLDFLLARDDLWYCTVDTDWGCGMIRTKRRNHLFRRADEGDETCLRAWRDAGRDYKAAFQLYDRHKGSLMNVVTVDDFLDAEWKTRKLRLKLPRQPLHRRRNEV